MVGRYRPPQLSVARVANRLGVLCSAANFHDAGDPTTIRVPLALLAALFDRLERYEPAATIAGFALHPITTALAPAITTATTHLREVLGNPAYESLAHEGETMTTTAVATYAYDQIDQARTELEHPG
jgi:hypothetical protein